MAGNCTCEDLSLECPIHEHPLALAERMQVVEYLRTHLDVGGYPFRIAADLIEKGEHVKGKRAENMRASDSGTKET